MKTLFYIGFTFFSIGLLSLSPCSVLGQPPEQSMYQQIEDDSTLLIGCMGWLISGMSDRMPVLNKYDNGLERKEKKPLLSIHGDVSYDFQYRSLVDTPYYQRNFTQHSIQANLNVVYKDGYPMRIAIRQRFNNSPFFRNIIDVKAQFNERLIVGQVKNMLSNAIQEWSRGRLAGLYHQMDSLKQVLSDLKQKITQLELKVSNNIKFDELVKAKESFVEREVQILSNNSEMKGTGELQDTERLKREVMSRYDSILREGFAVWSTDSVNNPELSRLNQIQGQLADVQNEFSKRESELKKTERRITDSLSSIKRELNAIRDGSALRDYVTENKELQSYLPKHWKLLSSVKNVGIGRSWVDYSDLTIKNISLSGVHAELNPSGLYIAAGVGRVNARFRDFVLAGRHEAPRQNIHFLRVGIGRIERNSLVLTYYNGMRALVDFISDSAGLFTSNLQRAVGVSLENTIRINQHSSLSLEVARSSFSPGNEDKEGPIKQIFNFNDRSNEAYSIKLNTYWPSTLTTINGFYRRMGAHFQSFNLQPVNTQQEAYSVKIKQLFWKKQLQLEAGIRKNDFSSPFLNPGLQSNTVFKSLLATLRMPKYPMVTVGFYPSSQLTLLEGNVLVENQYNTLTGVVSHSCRVKKVPMSTTASYLRFYNRAADTSFIYYNASNWSLQHSIFYSKLQFQSGISYAYQAMLKVLTIEQSAGIQLKTWLHIQGGGKYNYVNSGDVLWGGMGSLAIDIPKIGRLSFQYERSYLPGMERNLLPMDMGRFNFYRSF